MSNIILRAKYFSITRDRRAFMGTQKTPSALKVRGHLENKQPRGKEGRTMMLQGNRKRKTGDLLFGKNFWVQHLQTIIGI